MSLPVAIQVYSVRKDAEADLRGTLTALRDMGYDGVELAGLYGMKPAEVKAILEEVGLVPLSAHVPFQELEADIGCTPPAHGELTKWAKQGVLLMNTVLTVREGCPNSHKGMGWEIFTDKVISLLGEREQPTVFLLWGANARSKKSLITNKNHLVLECPHPSPLSSHRGFFGCRHFSKANNFLISSGFEPIDWQIE